MGQMTTVRQVKTHQAVVWSHESLVDLKIGGTAAQALNIDTPLLRVDVEGLEGSCLAKELNLIDVLVATIVSGTGIALGVLVGHGRAKGIEDGTGGNILGGDEEDGLLLTLDLFFLSHASDSLTELMGFSYHDLSDSRISLNQGLLHQLRSSSVSC